MPLIELKNIGKTYHTDGVDTVALSDISFSIDKGEFVAIMGPSGSGKSTLLHILGFLGRPTSGDYFFEDEDIVGFDDDKLAFLRNDKLGFVFQSFNLLKRATVYENIKLPLFYSDIPEKKWHDLVIKAIKSVNLMHRVDHESSQLSGGEKQRVAIARAIVNNPEVVFADEPTGNLDTISGGAVMDIIQGLNMEGHTVILITHEQYTSEYANRIITLRDGQLDSDRMTGVSRLKKTEFYK